MTLGLGNTSVNTQRSPSDIPPHSGIGLNVVIALLPQEGEQAPEGSLIVVIEPFDHGLPLAHVLYFQTERFFTPNLCQTVTPKSGAFHVGKTIPQLKQRLNDHIYYSANGKMLTPVSRHLDLYHIFNTSFVTFLVLEVVPQDPRAGDWDRGKETLWIERLNATYSLGINKVQS